MKTFYIKNRKTNVEAVVEAQNAIDACEKKGWSIEDCYVRLEEEEECRHEAVKDGWCLKCRRKVR